MTVSGLQIQNILKIYHRSIRWDEEKVGGSQERPDRRDRVEISVEGRKKQIRQKAADQVIERLTRAKDSRASFPREIR